MSKPMCVRGGGAPDMAQEPDGLSSVGLPRHTWNLYERITYWGHRLVLPKTRPLDIQDDLPSKALWHVPDSDWQVKAAGSHNLLIFSHSTWETEAKIARSTPNCLWSIPKHPTGRVWPTKEVIQACQADSWEPVSQYGEKQERETASGPLQESEVAFVEIKQLLPITALKKVVRETCVSKKVDWETIFLY